MNKYQNRQHMLDYLNNKSNAKRRNIPFELTYEQWWILWEPYYHLRGRGTGKYHLCRKGDTGPYSISNCYIDLHENNRAVQTPGVQKIFDTDEIIRLRKTKSAKEIGNIFGVTGNQIQRIIRENRAK